MSGKLWEHVLKTERSIAWDVYLLYGPSAKWEQELPPPDYWMHQLRRRDEAPRYNEEIFRAKLKGMLGEIMTLITDKAIRSDGKVRVEFLYFRAAPDIGRL